MRSVVSSFPIPKPFAASVGFVVRTPERLTSLTLRLPGLAFGALHSARERYDEYARVGSALLGRREPGAEESSGGEPLRVVPDDEVEDYEGYDLDEDLDDELAADGEEPAPFATAPFEAILDGPVFNEPAVEEAILGDAEPADEPSVTDEPPMTGAAHALAAAVQDRQHPPQDAPKAADLPVQNIDGLSLPQLRAHLSRLSAGELEALRDYESAHGRRLPVLSMLENRLAKITAATS